MRIVTFVLLILASTSANADGIGAIGIGGSNDAKMSHITGGQNYDINGGGGIHLLLGYIFAITPTDLHRFEAQLDIGHITSGYSKRGDENEATWSHWPVDLIYYYHNAQENFRLGYGAIYHFENKLEGKGDLSGITTNFDTSFGWTIAVDKFFASANQSFWGIGFRYDMINYHSSKFGTIDGNAAYLVLSAYGK